MKKETLNYFQGDELAADVWQGKYAQEGDETPNDMHLRMADEFGRIEANYKVIEDEISSAQFDGLSAYGQEIYDRRFNQTEGEIVEEIYNLFKDFKYIIPQGSVMSQLGAKSIGSLSNCFVVGQPDDSYGGIFQKDEEMAQLMKRRGGVGIDISTLRPAGTNTSNAAKTTTGAVSFMHRFSNTTREVAQNGRRGALMISMDINHPDVMDFIKIKRDLSQVTGANISIKLNDEFMKAVEKDEDYILRFPCDIDLPFKVDTPYNELVSATTNPKVYVKKIKAREYWDEIIKSAHGVAEPGLMFWDAMIDYSPDGVYDEYRQITTNPCSEIGMQPYDACRLIAVNLFSFVDKPFTKDAKFDMEKFYKINYEAMRLSDDLIDLEVEHIDRIIAKLHEDPEDVEVKYREIRLWNKVKETAMSSRRTGLGFTALGDTLAALGLPYDSDKALSVVETIMSVKLESELDCTIDLSLLRGPFESASTYKENNPHSEIVGSNKFYQFIYNTFPEQWQKMMKYNRRNVSWSTVAPTGTVSLMAQTTSGIEPLFMPYYMRRKKINPTDEGVRVDFTDQNGDTWQEFPVLHPKFMDWCVQFLGSKDVYFLGKLMTQLSQEDLERAFKQSPWYKSTANDINWVKRVEMQSIIQKYITHSISSTINLPNDVSEAEVSEIYLESWKQGVKGITVYRDGSRSGVLVSTNEDKISSFESHDAPKRPKVLPCKVHQSTSKGLDYLVIVGLLDEKPYEVFCTKNIFNVPNGILEADLIKVKKGQYDLDIKDVMRIEDISSGMNDEEEVTTRLVSTSLRHGAEIQFIVEQLGKTDGDMFSFTKSVARVLKKYIPDGTKGTVNCNQCGSDQVIFQEGCMTCQNCGNSKCG